MKIRPTRIFLALAAIALIAAACGDTASTTPTTVPGTATSSTDGSDPTTSEATDASTTSTPAPTTTQAATTTTGASATTTSAAGSVAPRGSFRVRGVAADDVLNVRSGAGVDNAIVAVFPPNAIGIRTTGAAAPAPNDREWWEVELFDRPETGWVNAQFLVSADQPPCSNNDGILADANVFVVGPAAGSRVVSGFTVVGCSRTFESTFEFRVLDADGVVVGDGFAMGGGADAPGTFAFRVTYSGVTESRLGTLEVIESDVSDGEGFPPVRNVIPVFLTPDGGPEPVNPPDPCSNADGILDAAFGIIVTTPRSGGRVSSGFMLEGCSNTFEAAVPWELRDREGNVIADGFTMGGGVDFQPFEDTVEFSVSELQIGTLIVNEEDVSDGEGPPPSRNEIPVVLRP